MRFNKYINFKKRTVNVNKISKKIEKQKAKKRKKNEKALIQKLEYQFNKGNYSFNIYFHDWAFHEACGYWTSKELLEFLKSFSGIKVSPDKYDDDFIRVELVKE